MESTQIESGSTNSQPTELDQMATRYWLMAVPCHGMEIYLPMPVENELSPIQGNLSSVLKGYDTVPMQSDFQTALQKLCLAHGLPYKENDLFQSGQYTVRDDHGQFHMITVCIITCETAPKGLMKMNLKSAIASIKSIAPNLHWVLSTHASKMEAIAESRLPEENSKGKTADTPPRKKGAKTNPSKKPPEKNAQQPKILTGNRFLDQSEPLTLIIPEYTSPMLSRNETNKYWTAFGERTCTISFGNHRHEAQKLARNLPGFDLLKGTDVLIHLGEFTIQSGGEILKINVYRAKLDSIEAQFNLGLRFVQPGELAETDGSHDAATHELYRQVRIKLN